MARYEVHQDGENTEWQKATWEVTLDKGVVFDSEGDCFFAYAGSTAAAGQLAQLIADLVREYRQRSQS